MRLACLVASLAKEYGGSTRANLDIVSAIRSFGLSLDLHVVGQTKESFQSTISSDLQAADDRGRNLLYPSTRNNPFGLTKLSSFYQLYNSLKNYDAVILSQFYGMHSVVAWFASRNRKCSLVLIPHGSLTVYHESEKQLRKRLFKLLVGYKILNRVHLIVTTSEMEQADLPRSLRTRSVVIPVPFNHKAWRVAKRSNNPRRILCVGRLTSKKRIDLAILSFATVKLEFPLLKMVIVGDGSRSAKKKILELLTTLNLENEVELRGWLSGEDLKLEYFQNQILLHISENENFSIVVPEALFSGNPVVINDRIGISWLVEKYELGVVIPNLEIETIVAGLRKILTANWDDFREIGPNAVQEELSPQKIALQWQIILEIAIKETTTF